MTEKYEYMSADNYAITREQIYALGEEGWEICAMANGHYYVLKRKKKRTYTLSERIFFLFTGKLPN